MSTTTVTPTTVHGIDALQVAGGGLRLVVTTGMGPRILAFGADGGSNLLAELPDATIDLPGLPRYRMLGGHRLWHTPEVPSSTYRPDESPVTATVLPDGVDLVGAADPVQGIQKRIRVTLASGRAQVEHELRNTGSSAITTAAWAITQVPPRGEAWVPLSRGELHGAYLPNRSIVLWPYSSLGDARLQLGDDLAVVRGIAGSEGRTKVGTQRERGWIAWRDGGTVLVIEAAEEPGTYGDMGAATQCYSCGDFVELETIGPVTTLAPGEALVHRETWRVASVDAGAPRDAVIASLGLAAG
ncbi:MAG: hypothetical protein U0869_06370 [Chloroflexota bacterium]